MTFPPKLLAALRREAVRKEINELQRLIGESRGCMWQFAIPAVLNMSVTAGIIIVVVLVLRLLLKRAESLRLWAIVVPPALPRVASSDICF